MKQTMAHGFGRDVSDTDLNGIPAVVLSDQREGAGGGFYRGGFKRGVDIAIVVLAAPFVVPVVALAALLMVFDGGRPFYTQQRVGLGGKIFRMWKLRSMVPDADARLEACLASDPSARREWEETQKLALDPRITTFGRVLRKTSIDELPQLWNVLVGEMSVVGPRPMMVCQREIYPGAAYYRMRPGITGYWQTAGRHKTSFASRARYDAAYEHDLSFPTDVAVLLRTVKVVLQGSGA